MNQNPPNGFRYSYSAKEQTELKKIREKYLDGVTPTADKMARLRRLDAAVEQKAIAVSLIVGVLGALLLGFGMSLIMTELRAALGLSFGFALALGLLSGLLGIAGVIAAYPLYQQILTKERKRVAPEILRLSEELLQEREIP